jgi:hypothetical protein
VIVVSLQEFKAQYPRVPDIQVRVTEVIGHHDGAVNGYCEYQDKRYYFIWVSDDTDEDDYFALRPYALVEPVQIGAAEDGKIIGWFLEGEADHEPWNKFRASNEVNDTRPNNQ